ncbi:cohesin domain-containing protein [Tumebacillus sp. BK434]|uniref:cohesin domain-containing protein n=1 Tax=Tumebacillus sp. BK434 TaxID=2512169 RepID=UPI0014048965|nr:cohesin domain-containing protein [Tumebacillus sp. BK434]
MMASLPTTPTVQFDVDVSDSSLYGIEDVDAYVVSRNATGLKTEEVTVSYDQEAFFLGEITPEPGFTILSTDTSTPGQIKVKLSSSGATFSTTAETRMFKIAMKSRAVNKTARIETSAGFATDSAGNVLPVIFGGENIALTYKVGDVNLDGYITVADLAMAASTYGSYTHLMSFADVNGDELVDDTDLALIAGLIQKPVIADGGYGYSMDLTQGGSARASSSHWNYNYYQPKFAFDGDTTSGFYWNAGTKVPSGWLEYDLRIRQMPVNKYSLLWQLHTGFESYMPKDWTFEGWDGWNQSWVVLDSKQGVTNWVTGNKQEFTFENNVAYDKYRINISASNNASYVGVGEMEMFSKIGASPAVGLDITRVDAAAGGAWNVAQGETFDASLIVHNYGNMQAEDATVTFDTNKLEFVEAVPVRAGVKIVKQDSSVPGKLRFVLANTGQTEDLNPGERTQLIKLTFKVKEGASGWVNLSMPLDSAWVGNWYGADFNATEQGAGLEVVQR